MSPFLPFAALLTFTTTGALASTDLDKRLARGEIVVQSQPVKGSSIPMFRVSGVVNAPVDKVWEVVRNCDGYVGVMPRVEKARTLKRRGRTATCSTRVDLPFPLSHLDAVTENKTLDSPRGTRRMSWKLVKGDYKKNRGNWELRPFGGADSGKTLIVYNALVEPRLAVPKGMVASGQKRELPAVIRGLRRAAKR